MSPADKAEVLQRRFWLRTLQHNTSEEVRNYMAKECALICCEEILQALDKWSASFEPYKFWEEVKNEIHKL